MHWTELEALIGNTSKHSVNLKLDKTTIIGEGLKFGTTSEFDVTF